MTNTLRLVVNSLAINGTTVYVLGNVFVMAGITMRGEKMNDNYSKKKPSVPNPDVGSLVRCTGPILSDKNYIKHLNQISEEERKRSISADCARNIRFY